MPTTSTGWLEAAACTLCTMSACQLAMRSRTAGCMRVSSRIGRAMGSGLGGGLGRLPPPRAPAALGRVVGGQPGAHAVEQRLQALHHRRVLLVGVPRDQLLAHALQRAVA